jgi:hypothetical protein
LALTQSNSQTSNTKYQIVCARLLAIRASFQAAGGIDNARAPVVVEAAHEKTHKDTDNFLVTYKHD